MSKHLLIFLAALAVFPFSASAATYVSGAISTDTIWTASSSPYVVQGSVTVNQNITLTVEKGVVVKFTSFLENSKLRVNGTLNALGTSADKIYFTSIKDDSVGGDTNGDGNATSPSATDWRHILFGSGSQGNFDYAVISYGGFYGYGAIYNYGTTTIANSQIFQNGSRGIYQGTFGSLTLTGSEVSDNTYGIYLKGGTAVINNNSIHDNFTMGVYNYYTNDIIDATNNWWGDASGPYNSTLNPGGTGNRVSDNVDFDPWLGADPSQDQIDPVIIVPGILGSWEKDGEWVIDPILHAYDNLKETLVANGYIENETLFGFPYQWRQSNVITAQELRDKINEVQSVCGCEKVDVVAHSMGGLVAREYIESDYYENDIDQLIFLGVPHLGATKSYLAWEAGELGAKLKDTLLEQIFTQEAIEAGFGRTSKLQQIRYDYIHQFPISSIPELLPIFDYLKDKDTGIIRTYPNNYPINSFLENLNSQINLDKLFSSSVRLYNIIGDAGADSTIDIIRVVPQPSEYEPMWEHGYPEDYYSFFGDNGLELGQGDKTVPERSATGLNGIDNITIESTHLVLPTSAQSTIFNILTGKDAEILIEKPLYERWLQIFVFSPVDIVIISPDGKKIGKDFTTEEEINEIEDAFYTGFNTANEFIMIPNPLDGEYQIIAQGTDSGDYELEVNYISDDNFYQTSFISNTLEGLEQELSFDFSSLNPEETEIAPIDEISPEAEIYFDVDSQTLKIEGTDNFTVNPDVSIVESDEDDEEDEKEKKKVIYQIKDEAENTLKLYFEKIKEKGKEIKAELEGLQYNDDPIIELSETKLKYEWSIDKKEDIIKELEQKIEVEDQFKIKAKYSHKKGETKIEIKENGEKIKQTLQGLIIIKLTTSSGGLWYEF